MHQTDRYRAMKKAGEKEDEIRKVFNTPVDMRVFSWSGPIDTIMSPMDSIRYHKSFLRTGFMSMDPRTGYVKAYVGGIDYNDFQYDMVNGGRRQIGSTIKPFLYSLAMIEGFSPCDEMLHVQNTYFDENGIPWTPRNASAKRVGEQVSIQWGLQNSDNWVTAWLMSQMSPYTFVRLLHSFGLKNQMDPVISICLGTPDVSVSEMVSGYSVFANKGIRSEPIYVTRIEDSYGNTIASFNSQMSEVLTEDASYKMLHMLKNVIDGEQAAVSVSVMGSRLLWAVRPVRRKTTPTVGSWLLHPAWSRDVGSVAKNVLSTSTVYRKDREQVWRCLSMVCSCRKYMPTRRSAIRKRKILMFQSNMPILVKQRQRKNARVFRQMSAVSIKCLNSRLDYLKYNSRKSKLFIRFAGVPFLG